MTREKRRGSPVLLAGLGGFAMGAATVLLMVWFYGAPHPAAPGGGPAGGGLPAAPGLATPGPESGRAAPGTVPVPAAPGAAAPGTAEPGAAPQVGGGALAPPAPSADWDVLRQHHLLLPVQGVRLEELRDSFGEGRSGHLHEAMDIMAARNTPVLAVEDGRVVKLFVSRLGGNTIYQYDPSQTYTYYYAHLDRYADGLHEGDQLRRGQVIGYVGSTGNAPANAPHLHFAIFRLSPDKHWWQGTAIDPYPVLAQP